jgi:hypothetical protein
LAFVVLAAAFFVAGLVTLATLAGAFFATALVAFTALAGDFFAALFGLCLGVVLVGMGFC